MDSEVKLKPLGKVTTIVWAEAVTPEGVVNLMTWLELALMVSFDMVSDSAVNEAALAISVMPGEANKIANAKKMLASFFIMLIVYMYGLQYTMQIKNYYCGKLI